MLYQKFRHSSGCSFPLNPGVTEYVVADVASVSLQPAIANALLSLSRWSTTIEPKNVI